MHSHLQYLQRRQIETEKWDHCIDTAANGLIYGFSWYLDHMARHWDALVWGDYEAVMPLTWNRKWGIRYLYQPPFTQQLGIFARSALTNELAHSFLNTLPAHFRLAEIYLNHASPRQQLPLHSNYILALDQSYEQLRANYKKDLLKNLKRAASFNMQYTSMVHTDKVLDAYKELYGARTPHVRNEDYNRFKNLCKAAGQDRLMVRAVISQNKLTAAALLLRSHNRLYLLHAVTWPYGRHLEANHFLLDSIIQEFAGTGMILDFEGSDIPGIAHFYKNFGSIDQPYFFYRFNRLPALLRWLK